MVSPDGRRIVYINTLVSVSGELLGRFEDVLECYIQAVKFQTAVRKANQNRGS